jgi:hypothetical protein
LEEKVKTKHPLHLAIGQLLRDAAAGVPRCDVVLDPACGGSQHLPLFLSAQKSNANRLCCIDGLILRDRKVRVLVEIEESDMKPTKVFGKFLTSALSRGYRHERHGDEFLPLDDGALFLQVLDTERLPGGTSKVKQWSTLARSIQEILPAPSLRVGRYELLVGTTEEFGRQTAQGKQLVHLIREVLLTPVGSAG